MGLHHITWRATASAVSNVDVLAEAMAWLIGDEEAVELDRSSSYHGPELTLIKGTTSNKRRAARSFARLGEANLRQLMEEFEQRVDDHNVLHFRLSMDSIIKGDPVLVSGTAQGPSKAKPSSNCIPDYLPMRSCRQRLTKRWNWQRGMLHECPLPPSFLHGDRWSSADVHDPHRNQRSP